MRPRSLPTMVSARMLAPVLVVAGSCEGTVADPNPLRLADPALVHSARFHDRPAIGQSAPTRA